MYLFSFETKNTLSSNKDNNKLQIFISCQFFFRDKCKIGIKYVKMLIVPVGNEEKMGSDKLICLGLSCINSLQHIYAHNNTNLTVSE